MASGLGFVHMALRVVIPPGSTSAQTADQLEIGELIGKSTAMGRTISA